MTSGPPATEDVVGQLAAMRVIPVVVLDDSAAVAPLAGALADAGLPCAEITLRTAAGQAAIGIMAQQRNLLVRAGTVLDAGQAERAVEAGARFIVSPGFDDEVIRRCRELSVPVLPGTATATETPWTGTTCSAPSARAGSTPGASTPGCPRPPKAVEYGAAHGALAMTTPGDTSTARRDEVDSLVAGAGTRADR